MSKTGWIILIVCLSLVFCICIGVFLAGRIATSLLSKGDNAKVDSSVTKNYKDLKNAYASDGIYTVRTDALKKLDIDWVSGSVTVEFTDGDAIVIREVADKTIREADALRYGVSESTLRIQACKKGHIGSLPRKELTVSLPYSLAEGLKECEIDTVSASVTLGEKKLDELEIDTVSGHIQLSKMIVEEAQLDTVSGAVSLLYSAVDSLRIDSVSGDAHISGTVNNTRCSSVSGAIILDLSDCQKIKVNTMSGPITLTLDETPKDLQIDTTSGKTRLTLPKDASCTIRLDTMSGKLYLNEEAISEKRITLGDGAAAFDIDSMSGSVHVYTK